MERGRFLPSASARRNGLATLAAGALLSTGCSVGPRVHDSGQPSAIPSTSQTESTSSPTPTAIQTEGTSTQSATAISQDQEILRRLQTALKGDELTIKNPLIGSVSRLTGNAVLATIDRETRNDTDVAAVTFKGGCIYDKLRNDNKLGKPILGFWKVGARVTEVRLKVTHPYSAVVPRTVFEPLTITNNGKTLDC
jgi:hypothetical protein